ncbi:MAG: glycosyltransferase [Phycisphaerae bacterium]
MDDSGLEIVHPLGAPMADDASCLVIAGGGTGGHLYPGLAVAEALRGLQPNFKVIVFGTDRPIDRKLTDSCGYELVAQKVRPFPSTLLDSFRFLRVWIHAVRQAKVFFRERRPAVVLGLGGYAAGPPIVAAEKLGIPTALFNPDAVPGVANRKLAGKVDRIFVQWHETTEYFDHSPKVRETGCPIRSEFARADRETAVRRFKLDPGKKTLLITGASQGAHTINMAVVELIDFWKEQDDWQFIHLTGPGDLQVCRSRYAEADLPVLTWAFTEHMPLCMAVADLVLSRAGASTLAEITAMGRASILMPYPFDRKRHQHANARILVDANAAALVEDVNDAKKNAGDLRNELMSLMKGEHRRIAMAETAGAMGRHDAAHAIAEALLEMARGKED